MERPKTAGSCKNRGSIRACEFYTYGTNCGERCKNYERKPEPCPFCGSEHIVCKYCNNPFDEKGVYGGYKAYCDECHCGTKHFKTPEEALAMWNRRKGW